MRRAKIVATLGPATSSLESIRALVAAGMDVARLNFSHGDYDDHRSYYDWVRAASDASGHAVGVLADLQGPKIRLGRFADGPTVWATGETVRITVDDCDGTHDRVSTTYKQLADDAVAFFTAPAAPFYLPGAAFVMAALLVSLPLPGPLKPISSKPKRCAVLPLPLPSPPITPARAIGPSRSAMTKSSSVRVRFIPSKATNGSPEDARRIWISPPRSRARSKL